METKTLFITAFIDLYVTSPELKSDSVRLDHFISLARTGIDLLVFTSPKYCETIQNICVKYQNVRIQRILELNNTYSWAVMSPYKENLPQRRNIIKDSFEFLTLMNAKLEFVDEAIQTVDYPQYAWIDFNIFHVLSVETSSQQLRKLARMPLSNNKVYIPGCWSSGNNLWDEISWRFCGGFFIGTKKAVKEFTIMYLTHIADIIKKNQKLTWEVNIWALLELSYGWQPEWYYGNHDSTILNVESKQSNT